MALSSTGTALMAVGETAPNREVVSSPSFVRCPVWITQSTLGIAGTEDHLPRSDHAIAPVVAHPPNFKPLEVGIGPAGHRRPEALPLAPRT